MTSSNSIRSYSSIQTGFEAEEKCFIDIVPQIPAIRKPEGTRVKSGHKTTTRSRVAAHRVTGRSN